MDLNTEVPYVGLPETADLEIKTILRRPYKEVRGRNIIKKGDILFARIEPSIFNKKYIFVNDLGLDAYAFTSTEFYIVKPKSAINTNFLFYMFFTDSVYNQILGKTTGSTGRRRLDKGVFENLLIPFPSIENQNKIVSLMQSAYQQKKQKAQEADNLINSIDDFVLDELGIKLPELQDKKCFVVNSEGIEGRIDPYYYKPSFSDMYNVLNVSKYPVFDFKELLHDVKNGVEIRTYCEGGYRYLRVTDLSETGVVDKDPRYVSVEEIPDRIKLSTNDFLISRSGSLGLVSIVTKDMLDYILSSHIFKITIDTNKLNPFYLQAFFRSKIGQFQFFHKNNGGIVPEINQEALKSIKVAVPPLDIQNKIADEVKRRMAQAEKMRIEAAQIIETAKQEVEKIILGSK